MPVLLAGWEPNDIAGTDFLDRSAVALNKAEARCHKQRLTEGMAVPNRPSAGLEGHRCADDTSSPMGHVKGSSG